MKKGILLINLGTPDSPSVKDVRKYLTEFLTDPKVIDIHPLFRFLLVRGLIVPFRSRKSALSYSRIWHKTTGSPLMHYSLIQRELLADMLGEGYQVELAMRYQQPSISLALKRLNGGRVSQLIVLPLFPQYASATTGSVIAKVKELMQKWPGHLPVNFIPDFHDHDLVIDAFAQKGRRYLSEGYDHVLFSFHGLPQQQLVKCDPSGTCMKRAGCCGSLTGLNRQCYAAQAYHMAYLIAERLKLSKDQYTVCFQSRLGKAAWIQPYTSEVLKELAEKGMKRVLVFCPSFVTDCLETLYEIGMEYKDDFIAAGGTHLQLAEGLNDDPLFTSALREIIKVHESQNPFNLPG